jgi:hypothetical protein
MIFEWSFGQSTRPAAREVEHLMARIAFVLRAGHAEVVGI